MKRPAYIPLPLRELLSALENNRFAVTPEIHRRLFIVVSRLFPDGLPLNWNIDGVAQVSNDDLQIVRESICPIIVRSESEQKDFQRIFETIIKMTLIELNQPNDPEEHKKIEEPNKPEKPNSFQNIAII